MFLKYAALIAATVFMGYATVALPGWFAAIGIGTWLSTLVILFSIPGGDDAEEPIPGLDYEPVSRTFQALSKPLIQYVTHVLVTSGNNVTGPVAQSLITDSVAISLSILLGAGHRHPLWLAAHAAAWHDYIAQNPPEFAAYVVDCQTLVDHAPAEAQS